MRSVSSAVYTALQQRRLVARDFLWLVARDRVSGAPVPDGYWSDVGSYTCEVISPETGGAVSRTFYGAGTLIQISDIPLVSNISVQNVTITLSQVSDRITQLVRVYDCRQAKVEIFRGLFDPGTRLMVAPAEPRFAGFIDKIEIKTPSENEEGGVVLTCASHTQEMTRHNSDTRSDVSQKLRSATDNFYQDTTVVGEWEQFWGRASGNVPTVEDRLKQARGIIFR